MSELRLRLAGDVMTGRGMDQLLPHPVDPQLYEPVAPAYPWGEALAAMEAMAADVRIINLATAITTAARPWPQKDIHDRMHPHNISCLTAAKLDLRCLANNHSLDWGWRGRAQCRSGPTSAGLRVGRGE
ncbi:CapA family protein [Synechococcus sp. HJ21-Hayes]|uniref:CapA family protein n=1 Tax=Synechococcus sp. HJ21-Hayes TaxID=2823736 RepID=UPI0020CF5A4C|nr:CapA family protein [Synechococcus sp. HJ21-Hayes]MCP9853491.1 CapA family protein [Synechococcus sp. HJ21-Hayes]